ncbi:MAG: hypothetical protein IJR42_07385 [Paludibacteraceae bacterium]|nr:hypothetical protein [Paludibacteraceae bacterium]
MKKNAILLTTLAARLEKAIHCDVGMQGLKILLYGWRRKYHLIEDHTFYDRRKEDGEAYLTDLEARSFSQYAGYDLTTD